MDKKELHELLRKFQERTATPEEKAALAAELSLLTEKLNALLEGLIEAMKKESK